MPAQPATAAPLRRPAWYRSKEIVPLVAIAALAALVVLHRRGTLPGVASSIGAGSSYSGLLGAPSIDTPQGVQQFLSKLPQPATSATSK
jgi:hypothetical protein